VDAADDDVWTDDDAGTDDDDDLVVAFDIDWELSAAIPTVVTVHWSVDVDHVEDAWIEFGPDSSFVLQAPAMDDGEGGYESILLGLKPQQAASFRAAVAAQGETARSDAISLVTGARPAEIPSPSLNTLIPESATAGYLVTALVSSPSYAVILDADGEVVWWHTPASLSDVAFIPQVVLSRDGKSVVYLALGFAEGDEDSKMTYLVRAPLDGGEAEVQLAESAHHSLVERSDGTLALLEMDSRMVDGEQADGDRIVELLPDGSKLEIFSTWDQLEYEPPDLPPPATGWTHANALDLSDDESAYYVSLKHLNTVVKVERATGEIMWQIGGVDSAVALAGGSKHLFEWQHQFEMTPGGILVFDNGSYMGLESRAVEYEFDLESGDAEQVWEHFYSSPLFIYCLGDVQRLPSGNTLVVWSSSGVIEEVTPQNELVLQLGLPLGAAFGYARWMETLYLDD